MKYKFIALDLDGTLLNSREEISEQNLQWIKKAEDAGLIVSFATGRGRPLSEQYWHAVSPAAPMVMVNGAEVWKSHVEIVSRHPLPHSKVPGLISLAKEYGAKYWTVGNDDYSDDYLKIGMHHDNLNVVSQLRDIVSSLGEFEVSSSAPRNLEVNGKGVSKAAGLSEVIALYGIKPSEVVVVGDSLNDLSMIQWAGLGVAMKNAADIIKDAADYITASNDEDGVAQVIQLILKQIN